MSIMPNFWWTDIHRQNFFPSSMLILGQKSWFLRTHHFEIPQPNWYYQIQAIILHTCDRHGLRSDDDFLEYSFRHNLLLAWDSPSLHSIEHWLQGLQVPQDRSALDSVIWKKIYLKKKHKTIPKIKGCQGGAWYKKSLVKVQIFWESLKNLKKMLILFWCY